MATSKDSIKSGWLSMVLPLQLLVVHLDLHVEPMNSARPYRVGVLTISQQLRERVAAVKIALEISHLIGMLMAKIKERDNKLEMNTNLCAWGTSQAVRLPITICEYMGISVGSKLRVFADTDTLGSYIVIRPVESHRSFGDAPYKSMDEIFSGYTGSAQTTEFDWGEDVGDEVIL